MTDAQELLQVVEWFCGDRRTSEPSLGTCGALCRIADRLEAMEKWRKEAVDIVRRLVRQTCACLPGEDYECVSCRCKRLIRDVSKETT